MVRRNMKISQNLMVVIITLTWLSVSVVWADVSDHVKNQGAVVASKGDTQIVSALRHAVSAIVDHENDASAGDDNVVDLAISPDNQRAYVVDVNGMLGVYVLGEEEPPQPIFVTRVPMMEITKPRALAIAPDATLAFVAGDQKIVAINLKPITVFSGSGDASGEAPGTAALYEPYLWTETISVETKNYVSLEVGPSGKYLYYLVENNDPSPANTVGESVYGELGAFAIERFMQVKVKVAAPPASPTATLFVLATEEITPAWKKEIVRPEAELGEQERGGSEAFHGPFSLTISPDEDYAIVTAVGSGQNIQFFDPLLGRIPAPDEATGGLLFVDLQANPGEAAKHGEYLKYLPTLVTNEPHLGARLARYARTVEHPVLTMARADAEQALNASHALLATGNPFAPVAGLAETTGMQNIWSAAQRIYGDYGILTAYQAIRTADMVGAVDADIDGVGRIGVAPMKWTNNVGFLELEPSLTLSGYGQAEPPGERFAFRATLERFTQGTALVPEEVALSGNGAVAYVGMRGGTESMHRFGFVDLVALRQEIENFHFSLTEASLVTLQQDDALPLTVIAQLRPLLNQQYLTVPEFDATLTDLGIDPAMRDKIKQRALTSSSLAERGLRRSLLELAAPAEEPGTGNRLYQPRNVATFQVGDVDGDGLSDQVEAYNRFNSNLGVSELVSATEGTLTTARIRNDLAFLGVLLPRSGLGYRHNERYGENKTNAGQPALIRVIERVGRIWHERYLAGAVPYANHSHFVVVDLSAPGWVDIADTVGNPAHAERRAGEVANIQYFRADKSDAPFEFIYSNNNDPHDNSAANLLAAVEFDKTGTQALIELWLCQPEVTAILIDPAVAYAGSDGRVIERGNNDLLNPGSLRDMDAWMQIQVRDVAVNLIANKDSTLSNGVGTPNWVAVPDHEEQINYGRGVAHTTRNSGLEVLSSLGNDPQIEFRLYFNAGEIAVAERTTAAPPSFTPIVAGALLTPGKIYYVDTVTLPADHEFTDVILKAYHHPSSGLSCDQPFYEDTVSFTRPVEIDLIAYESATRTISEAEEERPIGPGVYADPNKTILVPRQEGLGNGTLRLFFNNDKDEIKLTDNGAELEPGSIITGGGKEYLFDSWVDAAAMTSEVTLRGYDQQGNFVGEDTVSLIRVDLDLDVDSDNDDGNNAAWTPTDMEDELEERQAKYIIVNQNDSDGDGIPDYADSDGIVNEDAFIPIKATVALPFGTVDKVRFVYPCNRPTTFVLFDSIDGSPYNDYIHGTKDVGDLRIMIMTSAAETRSVADIVRTGQWYTPTYLGMTAATTTFYLEGINGQKAGDSVMAGLTDITMEASINGEIFWDRVKVQLIEPNLGVNGNNNLDNDDGLRVGVPDIEFEIDENDEYIEDQKEGFSFWLARDDIGVLTELGAEDLAPFVIDVPQTVIDAGFKIYFRLKGLSSLDIYESVSPDDEPLKYLQDDTLSTLNDQLSKSCVTLSATDTDLAIATPGRHRYVMKTKQPGMGRLELLLYDPVSEMTTVADSVRLTFKDVREFYPMYSTRGSASGTYSYPLEDGHKQSISRYPEATKISGTDRDENKTQYLLAIHGYNVNLDNVYGEIGADYKRFYWAGYRGNFIGFTWEGDQGPGPGNPYAANVENAFQTSPRLLEFIDGTIRTAWSASVENITVFAHSLGTQVALDAMRLYQVEHAGEKLADHLVIVEPAIWSDTFRKHEQVEYTEADNGPGNAITYLVPDLREMSWAFWFNQPGHKPVDSVNTLINSYNRDDFALWVMICDDHFIRNEGRHYDRPDAVSDRLTYYSTPLALDLAHEIPALLKKDGRRPDYSIHDIALVQGQMPIELNDPSIVNLPAAEFGFSQWSHNGHKGGSDSDISSIVDDPDLHETEFYAKILNATLFGPKIETPLCQIWNWFVRLREGDPNNPNNPEKIFIKGRE